MKNVFNKKPGGISSKEVERIEKVTKDMKHIELDQLFYPNGDTSEPFRIRCTLSRVFNFVTLTIHSVIKDMDEVNYFLGVASAVPYDMRPKFAASTPFCPVVGKEDSDYIYDSDVLGLLQVLPNGRVVVFKEPPNGTSDPSTWSGPICGWNETSITYCVDWSYED